jgi:uncharacterized membrane protein
MPEDLTLGDVRNSNQNQSQSPVIRIATISLFIALETIATMMISIAIPLSNGYFNVGEGIIFVAAILFGPITGALTGGIGAALADLLLGYAVYAPATFVGKGLEGLLVGLIFQQLKKSSILNTHRTVFTTILGFFVGGTIILLGLVFTQGDLWIGINSLIKTGEEFELLWDVTLTEIVHILWVVMGLFLAIFIWVLGSVAKKDTAEKVLSILPGGLCMVLTYFFYQIFLFGLPAAIMEIPINLLQMFFGIVIALPLTTILAKYTKNF